MEHTSGVKPNGLANYNMQLTWNAKSNGLATRKIWNSHRASNRPNGLANYDT